jgi:NAD(P)-dependent dehydrogenase (short-subunit alcohol dehydrogenase family)
MKTLRGRTAAITGAASGLGRAMALAFADEGMNVALGDVADLSDTFAQVEARGRSAVALTVDVSKQEDVERFAQLVDRDLGGADLVCNNDGV